MLIGTTALHEEIKIPEKDIATAGTAILAMRGAGKSWLNAVLAEGISRAKIPFAIVDPEGEYWTLRVKFSNVVVAGGEHADIPLDLELAELLAQAALEEHLELVVDLSNMRRHKQIQFLTKFLGELFFRETELRIPFWVNLEEADLWVPQTGNPQCKGAVLDICQRGRKRGIGFSLVSQRPATIDKTALSQVEFRFFKRFQQPHDLRAVADYLGPYSERTRILPSLKVEETLLYAPTISQAPVQLRVAPRASPHGGATPEQIALIKPSTTILELRRKFESFLSEKRIETSKIEQLKSHIIELESKLVEKEKELSKVHLASDVAGILIESGISFPEQEKNSEEVDLKEPSTTLTILDRESILFIGSTGIDIHSGLVVGNELANLLLNRMVPDERIIFLALKRTEEPLRLKELSRLVGFSETKSRRIIGQLIRKGLIGSVGRRRRGQLYAIKWEEAKEVV